MPARRDPLPDDLKKNTPMERRIQEYLVRDVLMKAQYRLALSLWKCGAGAWQSAMDIICEAESLAYFHDEDRLHFRALHNQILKEIEAVMAEEDRIRHFLKTEKGWTLPMLVDHRNAGIRGLLQSRFTRIPLELYPWDNDSITWENKPSEAVRELNEGMAGGGVYPCHYILRMEDDIDKPPKLSLTANKSFDASEVVFAERSAMQVVLPADGLSYCNNCGASLNVPEGTIAGATVSATVRGQLLRHRLAQNMEPPDRTITSSPSTIENMDNSGMSGGRNRLKEGDIDDTKDELASSELHRPDAHRNPKALLTDNPSGRWEGYQICHGCKKVAFCSSRCMDRAMHNSHHFFLCRTSARASSYSISHPSMWPIPDPKYTLLLNRLVERTIGFAMGTIPPLAQHWVRVLQGNIDSPLGLPKDLNAGDWDSTTSIPIQELYPHWETIAMATQPCNEKERKDSKQDDELLHVDSTEGGYITFKPKTDSTQDGTAASPPLVGPLSRVGTAAVYEYFDSDGNTPNTTPGTEKFPLEMVDWSFENNVRFPLRVIHEVFHRECPKTALRALLDVTLFDGWMLETIRVKVEANMRIQRLPKLEINFDEEGKVASQFNYEQQVVESAYSPPLFRSDNDNWMASLHPLCSGIRKAGLSETPNVRLFDRDGALVVSATRRIDVGDALLH